MSHGAADLSIIGAGAAGLTAAIVAAEQGRGQRITVLDGAKKIGTKILISGGGRCNVTHDVVTASDYCGNRRIIKNVLAGFSVQQTIAWFASMGVALKREETGKLFPVTDRAQTVLQALIGRCQELKVELLPDHHVTDLQRVEEGFLIHLEDRTVRATQVILATGGRSLPKSGSEGSGYGLAKGLGHQVTPTVPALVPLVLNAQMFHRELVGSSQPVELITTADGQALDRRTGSLLWTHFGISGPVVMDASRFVTSAHYQGQEVGLFCNFFPGHPEQSVRQWFMARAATTPRRRLSQTLSVEFSERFAVTLCRHAGCDPQTAIGQCSRTARERLLKSLVKCPLPVARDRGWNHAEVTAGGVPLEEVDYRTMESKLVPDLYLVGEILDCDGRIGGFNFQWAWSTGYLAGRAASRRIAGRL